VAAAMLIIALAAALVVALVPGTGRAQLKAVALETAALMRRERLDAILTGQTRAVAIDGDRRALLGQGGQAIAIPRDVVVAVLGVNETWSGNGSLVRFAPDGSSTGAVLKLSREGAEYEIRVNWYTGAVTILPE
jgi:general secretion pathway protein H